MPQAQSTHKILMVEPADFTFNAETAVDNEFQNRPNISAEEVKKRVMQEFDAAIDLLTAKGIKVFRLKKNNALPSMPDAVFPNNWFSTDPAGNIYVYPMAAANRRNETMQLPDVQQLLAQGGMKIQKVIDLTESVKYNRFLEGTGSMVFDRINSILYAAISVRTDKELAEKYAKIAGFNRVVAFETKSSNGMPFYHTNVVMSVGTGYSIVCLEAVPDTTKRMELQEALALNGDVIPITLAQAERSFCANGLEVLSEAGTRYFVLSQSAYDGFSLEQREQIARHAELLPIKIPTIEYIGGGSARCMMAEVFLP
jgi:hypothetical protein